jgi:hypothetical protein
MVLAVLSLGLRHVLMTLVIPQFSRENAPLNQEVKKGAL